MRRPFIILILLLLTVSSAFAQKSRAKLEQDKVEAEIEYTNKLLE
jgi:hypothetical protein